jgi:hypothetical protein
MVDFKKLMDRSPEAVAEREATRAREEAAFAAHLQRTIDARREVILALERVIAEDSAPGAERPPRLTEWEIRFVRDMSYRADTYDEAGAFGGRLAALSDKQAAALERLSQAHLSHLHAGQTASSAQPVDEATQAQAASAMRPRQ